MPQQFRSGKPRSLTAALDTKILVLVRQYIDDAIEDGDTPLFHKGTGTLRLSVSQLCQYVSAVGDSGLQRTKKAAIEKSIERAIGVINAEQEKAGKDKAAGGSRKNGDRDEDEDEDGEGLTMDSDFEGIDVGELVEVKQETNAVNKRIVDIWSLKRQQSTDQSAAATPPPPTASPVTNTATRVTTTTRTTSVKPSDMETPVLPSPAVTSNGNAAPAVPSPKKRKEKASSSKEGSSKRQKADKESREPPSYITLADLGGVDHVISELLELIGLPLTHPEVYTHTGVPPPRGVLLHGPPGCGKTMIAHAIAGEIGLPFISISAPSIVSGMSGESEKKLRDLFDEAREKAPCIMFLDEIDAITPKRESAQREMERRIVAQMLTCMDDLTLHKTNGKPVIIIGATNRPDSLDPALRRAGRFDREICLGVPDEVGREKILKVLSKKLRLSGDFDFRKLAKMTPGFVGADLNALTAAAGICAIKRIFHTLKQLIPADALEDGGVSLGPREVINENGAQADSDSVMDIDSVDQQPSTISTNLVSSDANPNLTSSPAPPSSQPPQSSTDCSNTQSHLATLHAFFHAFPAPLTPEQLAPLSITLGDFLTALPKIQPSSKREGFATVPDVTWADIGALDSVRIELQIAIVQPIKNPELYRRVGVTAPTGVLLWGPPGCGKTLLAKAVANESKANFISVRGPELLNKYVGESERAVRQVFTRARASAPCVIFFDELDALVPRRDDALSDASSRVVNTLLTELDGLSDRAGVYVVGATNRPDVIDPAMLRPGRLDKALLIDLPTKPERSEILKTLTRKRTPLAPDVDLDSIAADERCDGFSGADLAALVREAAMNTLKRNVFVEMVRGDGRVEPGVNEVQDGGQEFVVEAVDFERAFQAVKPSVSKEQRGQYRKLATKFGW
ncbi:P-loop containing nucleoside triphosphate hydrolase protein [Kalaharituber pfeilii]|nr:P-loop containing nucleoside triphosphate hydrolase protein [Kalaharituber pfeilii]